MNNKRGKKKNNFFKDILLVGTVILSCLVVVSVLVPGIYSLFMHLLNLSINLLGIAVIGMVFAGLVVALGIATKCIRFETTYEYVFDEDMEVDEELMRKQLSIVKSNDKVEEKVETTPTNKYSYIFDNNYSDAVDEEKYIEEEIIDDVIQPYKRLVSVHRYDGGYSRVRANYKGKYSR